METTFQKYRDIKARYDSLVEKNNQNLVYENGAYFKKSLYDKDKKENKYPPEKSDSRLVLKDEENEIFVVSVAGGDFLYIYNDNTLHERVFLARRQDLINSIENLEEKTNIEHYPDGRIYIRNFETNDLGETELTLEKLYKDNELLDVKNYKKDFKITKEQMLENLPQNFLSHAAEYIMEEQKRKYANGLGLKHLEEPMNSEIEQVIKKKIAEVHIQLKDAIDTKNEFYKKIRINRNYDENKNPVYHLNFENWIIDSAGKTNKVLNIQYVTFEE